MPTEKTAPNIGGGVVGVDGVSGGVVARVRGRELRRRDGHAEPDDGAGGEGEEQQRAAAYPLDQEGPDYGPAELLAVVDEGDVGLGDPVGVAGGVEDRAEEVGEHGVAGPLAEGGEEHVAGPAVPGGLVAEEGAVVPPALVRAVLVEQRLVLVELELYPGRVRVAAAVVRRQDPFRLLLAVIDIEPAGRLGEEHAEEDDEAGEEGLEPGDEPPGVVTAHLEGAARRSGGDNSAGEPQGVVHGLKRKRASCQCQEERAKRPTDKGGQRRGAYPSLTSYNAAESRVVNLDDVHGPAGGSNGDTEAQQEAAAHELARPVAQALDDGADDDDDGADEHADAASVAVDAGADKGQGDDASDLVHGGDDAGPDAVVLDAVALLEGRVLEEVVDEGTVVAVHGAAEEADGGEGVDENLSLGPRARGLLDHGFVEGFIAGDDFGVDDLGL